MLPSTVLPTVAYISSSIISDFAGPLSTDCAGDSRDGIAESEAKGKSNRISGLAMLLDLTSTSAQVLGLGCIIRPAAAFHFHFALRTISGVRGQVRDDWRAVHYRNAWPGRTGRAQEGQQNNNKNAKMCHFETPDRSHCAR